jgi:hypothetical protein
MRASARARELAARRPSASIRSANMSRATTPRWRAMSAERLHERQVVVGRARQSVPSACS